MPGTTSTALNSFSHDQLNETDAAKRKGGGALLLGISRKCCYTSRKHQLDLFVYFSTVCFFIMMLLFFCCE